MDINYSRLPGYMQDGMRLYVERGIEPGSFLAAVLSNDLMEALRRGDDVNQRSLRDYGMFLYNEAPCGCFGSVENYRSWIKHGGLVGNAEAA